MRAVLLAAGRGTRMQPLTRTLPKPLLPVLGVPLVERVLGDLAGAGYDTFAINAHHLAGRLEDALSAWNLANRERRDRDASVRVSRERVLLGTGGGIKRATALLGDGDRGPVLVRNTDFLTDVDLAAGYRHHRDSGLDATLVLGPAREGFTGVWMRPDGRIVRFGGADPGENAGPYLFTGVHWMEPRVIDRIPDGVCGIVDPVYRELAAEGRLGGCVHDGAWLDFGIPSAYLDETLRLVREPGLAARIGVDVERRRIGDADAVLAGTLRAADDVRWRGAVAVGEDVEIAAGASLRDAVVLEGAHVGAGARLDRVVIGPGAVVPEGATLEGTVAAAATGDEGDVEPDATDPVASTIRRSGDLYLRPLDPPAP